MTVDPVEVDFGEIATGEVGEQAIKLTNTGSTLARVVTPRGKAAMYINMPPNLVIAPGASREIKVHLTGGVTPGTLRGKHLWIIVEGQRDINVPLKSTAVSFVMQEPDVLKPEMNPDGRRRLFWRLSARVHASRRQRRQEKGGNVQLHSHSRASVSGLARQSRRGRWPESKRRLLAENCPAGHQKGQPHPAFTGCGGCE